MFYPGWGGSKEASSTRFWGREKSNAGKNGNRGSGAPDASSVKEKKLQWIFYEKFKHWIEGCSKKLINGWAKMSSLIMMLEKN